jgi:hypothetical protein
MLVSVAVRFIFASSAAPIVVVLLRVRQHQHDVIGARQQLVLRYVLRGELRLDFRRDARAVVIDHLHAEAARAARSAWPMRPIPITPSVDP